MVAYTNEQKRNFLQVLKDCRHHIGNACSLFGIGRQTYYDWINNDNWFKEQVNEIMESQIDDAEQIHEYLRIGIPDIRKVKDDDGNEVERMVGWIKEPDRNALEFFLERKGKTRGWGRDSSSEREKPGEVVIIRIPDNGRDEMEQRPGPIQYAEDAELSDDAALPEGQR